MRYSINLRCYVACVQDLLDSPQVQSMRQIPHHPGVNCYDHSVFVSYVAFRLARRCSLNYMAAARGGLLHDLYLYNSHDRSQYEGNQCFAHPKAALRNARALCADLTPMEENIIISHMWPLARRMPHSREAVIVGLSDKLCAAMEVFGLYRYLKRKPHLPAPA
ncbi:MAG: phosphohydrolase [Intestinimonas sp.]|nr:phosphohydrolase [Intestinimonas sp.]